MSKHKDNFPHESSEPLFVETSTASFMSDDSDELNRVRMLEDEAALAKARDQLELEIVYTGPVDLLEYGGKKLINDKPIKLPARDAAALVKAYPEYVSFVDMTSALQQLGDLVRDTQRREREALETIAASAPQVKALKLDAAAEAAKRSEVEAKKAAVERALKGE